MPMRKTQAEVSLSIFVVLFRGVFLFLLVPVTGRVIQCWHFVGFEHSVAIRNHLHMTEKLLIGTFNSPQTYTSFINELNVISKNMMTLL